MSEATTTRDECQHAHTEIRRKVNTAGVNMYKLQCLDCGYGIGEWIKKSAIAVPGSVKPWDETLAKSGWELVRQEREQATVEKTAQFWSDYNAYLQSPEWAVKRKLVLQRDHFLCTARLSGCLGRATQAHHLSGDYRFNEPLFDLTSVCQKCHDEITRMDRERTGREGPAT